MALQVETSSVTKRILSNWPKQGAANLLVAVSIETRLQLPTYRVLVPKLRIKELVSYTFVDTHRLTVGSYQQDIKKPPPLPK